MQPANREGEALFCTSAPRVQKAWDHTSLALYKTCPRKYQLAIHDGWRPKTTAAPLEFGGLLHKAFEIYDKARAKGLDKQSATRLGLEALLKATTTYVWCLRDEAGKVLAELAEPPAPGQVVPIQGEPPASMQGRLEPRFWNGDGKNRTRYTLLRTFVWYVEHFATTALQPAILSDGEPAIEKSFRVELPLTTPDGDPYIWCGHIDEIGKLQDFYYIVERKHTVSTLGGMYFDRFSPNSQVSGYNFGVRVAYSFPVQGTIIDAAQVAVTFSRFGRGIASRTEEQLEEWLKGTLQWLKRAEQDAIQGYWPMNEESCHVYGGCQFRGICAKSPSVRQPWLQAEFVQQPWNPLISREDTA